ncbi:MAG TPA: hypothetical protein VKB52_08785 [Rhodanobacteraceae bacterium]|nr:hypothetical protein [Rhodanobacteraceae bacterium]
MSTTRTIAVTGATEQDAARITSLLERHRHKLSHAWASGEAADADLLLVDIESTYGQMDWLRARSRGRLVIAYTSAAEPLEPEFSLRKPVVSGELVALLNRFAAGMNGKPEAAAPMRPANAETYDASSAPAAANDAKPASIVAARPAQIIAPMPAKAEPAPPPVCFIDELLGMLDPSEGPVRLTHEGLPSIIIDPARQRWYAGVGGLKTLAGWSRLPLRRDQLLHLDATEFANATEIMTAQPYPRLVWFARLTRSEGNLDAGLPADARYRLLRWPQVEREFPKHFRIATQMMRGTGTIDEIAAQSTAGIADVVDFINAYNALGYVECEAMLPVTAPNDRSGLLERVRKSLRN